MSTDDLGTAVDLFFFLKEKLDEHPKSLDDFCVWDNDTMNVVFHEGKFLTTHILKKGSR